PEPIALLQGQGYQYLLLEWISPGRQGSASLLGEQLARFHAAGVGAEELPCVDGQYSDRQGWGFPFDNFIGRTPQINSWRGSWAEFFGDCRLGYLVGLLKKAGLADKTMLVLWDKLRKHLAEYLPEPEDASLLHGDLWSGNYMTDQSGQPVLYDPAVYVGDHEADLAMMQLFGNPVPAFWEAYRANFKLDKEYPRRREIYNLYHLMNHLLLFGRGYHSAVIHSLHGILDRPVIFP
ncbi:MAG: fructosamine kinase family protein, partial [Spirochaetaceae bacterium]